MSPYPGLSVPAAGIGPCPGCGREIMVVGDPTPGVSHVLPMCADFEAMDALAFLRWVNDIREAVVRPVGEG